MRAAVLALVVGVGACRGSQPPAVPHAPAPAGYFDSIKRAVRAKWKPQDMWRRRIDPDGSKYGRTDRYTLVHVRLSPEGKVVDAFVEESSGVPPLDNLAVRAFREAAPFPQAPPELVEARVRVVDFRFGFYFDLDGKPGKPRQPGVSAGLESDGGVAADDGGPGASGAER